ncbi:MAG: serine/threonine-protein kinase, partial [Bradymonadaceae bacterium]
MVDRSQAIPCGVFELSKFIGDGSTGQVWKGTHSVQGIDVAVKILDVGTKRSWNERRFIKESFEKEIEAITSLNHPGIVRIFDVGRTDQQTADQSEGIIAADQPYIAMEYAPEGALRHHSRVSRWLDLKHLLFQLLDALAYAHSREVLHRDIKPENVLVFLPDDDDQKRPEPADDVTYELTDFGLAHPLSSENMATKDVFEAGAGTPTYMAPEQLKKEWRAFGPWTDLYSLGCMIYETTCGQSPYRGDTVSEVMMKHLKSDIPPIEPDFPVPDEFAVWLERLMAKQPRDRFECAADAAYALSLFTSESTRESTQSVDPGPDESDEETLQSWSTAEYFPSEDSEETESVEKSGVYRSSRSSAITSQSRRQTQRQTGRFGGDEGIEDPEE